jgi:hypothetical protein
MRTKEYEEKIHYLMVQPVPKKNELPSQRRKFNLYHLLQNFRQFFHLPEVLSNRK